MNPSLSPFVKLADASKYIACAWDLSADHEGRAHWVAFFIRHLETILKLGMTAAEARGEAVDSARARADACRAEFVPHFNAFAADPSGAGMHGLSRVTILTLDTWRDRILRNHGFIDAFIDLKNRENAAALPLLPKVCTQIDALDEAEQLRAVIEGVFAGNIFDMGAEATAKAYLTGGPDFFRDPSNARPAAVVGR